METSRMNTEKTKPHYAWWVLAACCAIQASAQGLIACTTGVFNQPVCADLGFELGSFTLGQTCSAIAMLVSQPFASFLYRKCDMRKLLLATGAVFYLCEFLLSFAGETWQWYVLLSVQGLAGGFFHTSSMTLLVCRWFFEKTAFALGLVNAAGSLFGMAMNPVVSAIVSAAGWRAGYRVLALAGAAAAMPFVLLIRSNPVQLGLRPFGASGAGSETGGAARNAVFPCRYGSRARYAAACALFLLATVCNVCGGYYQHLASYASVIGLAHGAALASCELGGVTAVKFLVGPMIERLGLLGTELALNLLSLAGFAAYFFADGPVLFATSALCGIYSATNYILLPIFARQQLGEQHYQSILPLLSAASAVLSAGATTLFGVVFDRAGSYLPMFAICMACNTVSLLFIFLIRLLGDRGAPAGPQSGADTAQDRP